jgi:hypothetical protein
MCGEDEAAPDFRDLWDDRVSEYAQAVHPRGNPMSHSTHVGFSEPRIAFWPCDWRPERLLAVGVGHRALLTASIRFPPFRPFLGVTRPPCVPSVARSVGHIRAAPNRVGLPLMYVSEPLSLSAATGVGQSDRLTARPSSFPLGPLLRPSGLKPCGVGHNEDTISFVRGTDRSRRHSVPFRIEPEAGQVSEYVSELSESKEPCRVLQQDPLGS